MKRFTALTAGTLILWKAFKPFAMLPNIPARKEFQTNSCCKFPVDDPYVMAGLASSLRFSPVAVWQNLLLAMNFYSNQNIAPQNLNKPLYNSQV
jgi:hypothetical protein